MWEQLYIPAFSSYYGKGMSRGVASIYMAAILIATLSLAYLYQPYILWGEVDHKAVVGVRMGRAETLLIVGVDGITLKASHIPINNADNMDLRGLISIYESIYDEVYYTVSIRSLTGDPLNGLRPGETLAYIVDKYDFINVDVGDEIVYLVNRADPLRIVEVIEL